MNKEDYVSLDVAKLLKEKGYPQDYKIGVVCRLQNKANPYYEKTREITEIDMSNTWCIFNEIYPTLYEAQKWLRSNNIYVSALPTKDNGKTVWYFQVSKDNQDDAIYCKLSDNDYNSCEEALNNGILMALQLL